MPSWKGLMRMGAARAWLPGGPRRWFRTKEEEYKQRTIGHEKRARAVRMHGSGQRERDLPLVAGAAARREASMVGLRRGEGRGGGRDGEEKRESGWRSRPFFFSLGADAPARGIRFLQKGAEGGRQTSTQSERDGRPSCSSGRVDRRPELHGVDADVRPPWLQKKTKRSATHVQPSGVRTYGGLGWSILRLPAPPTTAHAHSSLTLSFAGTFLLAFLITSSSAQWPLDQPHPQPSHSSLARAHPGLVLLLAHLPPLCSLLAPMLDCAREDQVPSH